jgi:hypothetical protein
VKCRFVVLLAALCALAACGGDDNEPAANDPDVINEPDVPESTCALISEPDVERLMGGASTAPGVESEGLDIGCTWTAEAGPEVALGLAVGDPTAWDEAREADDAQPVTGVGDDAVLVAGDSGTHTLDAYRGDYYVTITATGPLTTEQATPILREVANAVFDDLRE